MTMAYEAAVNLIGTADELQAAFEAAADSGESAADTISSAFESVDASASSAADAVDASFTEAGASASAAIESASARIDASLDAIGVSAGAAADAVDASFTEAGGEAAGAVESAGARIDASLDAIGAAASGAADVVESSTARIDASLDTASASADRMGESVATSSAAGADSLVTELGGAGALAGAEMHQGVADGAADITDTAAAAGEDAGAALSDGVAAGTDDMVSDLAGAGILAGSNLRSGVSEGAEGVEDDAGDIGESSGGAFSSKFGLGVGVAAAAVVAFGVDLATKMQTADTAIATSEGISTSAAKNIGTAFLRMSNEFGGKEMATAFAGVAGQLKSMNGQALTTAQSTAFMSTAAQLATAKQITLKGATSSLAAVMQAYQIKLHTAAHASVNLFEAANATGQSVTSVGNAVDKVKTKLGGLSPSLTTISALLVDMTDHGETGRAAMSSLSTAFTAFLKPASAVATAQRDLTVATKALTPTLAGYAKGVEDGKMKLTQLTTITTKMTSKQAALWSEFTSSYTASIKAATGYKRMGITALTATGKLKPLKTIVAELHTQIKGMSTAQATAALTADGFGSSAAKLVKVVQGGTTAFTKAKTAVSRYTAVQKAATEQNHTFDVVLKTIKADLEDWLTIVGQVAMPVLGDFFGIIERGVNFISDLFHWFQEGEPIVTGLAGAIGGMLVPVLAESVANAGLSAAAQVTSWATTAAASIKGAGTTQSSWITVSRAASTSAASTDESGSVIEKVVSGIGGVFQELVEKVTGATSSVNSSVESVGAVAAATAGRVGEATESIDTSVSDVGAVAAATAGRVGEATDSIDTSLRGMGTSAAAADDAFRGGMAGVSGAAEGADISTSGSLTGIKGALAGVSEEAGATEGAMSISMGGMLGPIGLVAGAAGGLAGVFLGLFHHTTAAAQSLATQIQNVNQRLRQVTTSTVAKLKNYMVTLNQKTLQYEQTLEKLSAGSEAAKKVATEVDYLTQKTIEAEQSSATLQANQAALAGQFGLTRTQVVSVAASMDLTLKKALTPQRVTIFAHTLATTSTIALTKVQDATKVSSAALIATAQGRTKALEAATATYSAYAVKAWEERVALDQKTSVAATAAIVNGTQGGLPAFEAIMHKFGVTIPKQTTTDLKQTMGQGGIISTNALFGGIESGWTKHDTEIAHKAERTVDMISGKFVDAKGQFITAGTTIPTGLVVGIDSGTAAVSAAVAKLVTNALVAGKAAAKSASPSQLYAKTLGKPMGQGVAVGITGAEGDVGAAITTIVKKALTSNAAGFAAAAAFGKAIAAAAATSFVKAFTPGLDKAGFAAAAAWEKTLATKAKMAGLAAATAFNAAFTSKANKAGFAAAAAFGQTLAAKQATRATVGVNASVYTARSQLTAAKGVLGATTVAAYQKMLTSAVKGGTKTKIASATTAITDSVETMLGNLSSQYAKSFSTGLKKTLYKTIESLSGEKATLGTTYLRYAGTLEAALKTGKAGTVSGAVARVNAAATAKMHPVTPAAAVVSAASPIATTAMTSASAIAASITTSTTKALTAFMTAVNAATGALKTFDAQLASIKPLTGGTGGGPVTVQAPVTVNVTISGAVYGSIAQLAKALAPAISNDVRTALLQKSRTLGAVNTRTPKLGLG